MNEETKSLRDARRQNEVPEFTEDMARFVNAARLLVDTYDAMLGASFWNAYDELVRTFPIALSKPDQRSKVEAMACAARIVTPEMEWTAGDAYTVADEYLNLLADLERAEADA